MSKSALLSLALSLAMSATGGSAAWESTTYDTVNDLPGVVLEAIPGHTLTTHTTLRVVNQSEFELTFGEPYCLEKLRGQAWYQVPYRETDHEPAWIGIGYGVGVGEIYELPVTDWYWLHGEMAPGDYRVVKEGTVGRHGDITTYAFAAEFTIAPSKERVVAGQNALPGVSMEVVPDSVSPTKAQVQFVNGSELDLTTGLEYSLERKRGEVWEPVPTLIPEDEVGWDLVGYPVGAGATLLCPSSDWDWLYGQLKPGQYRMLKTAIHGTGDDMVIYPFAAEFAIR